METQRVPLSAIYFTPTLYPRKHGVDYALVSRYLTAMENGAKFPPLDLAQGRELIDGAHRYLAYCNLQEKRGETLEVEVNVHDVEAEEEILKLAIERNCIHGRSLTVEDLEFVVEDRPGLKAYLATLIRFGFVMDIRDDSDLEFTGATAEDEPEWLDTELSDPAGIQEMTSDEEAGSASLDSPPLRRGSPPVSRLEDKPPCPALRRAIEHQPLIREIESLKLKGLLNPPAEHVIRLLTATEQAQLIERLGARLPIFARLSTDVSRLAGEFIRRNRERGFSAERMVEGILEMGPIADLFTSRPEAQPTECDPFHHLRLRSASIRNQVIQTEASPEQKIDYLDWEMAEWMRLYLSLCGRARDVAPHDFKAFPDLKRLRTVEVEHGIL